MNMLKYMQEFIQHFKIIPQFLKHPVYNACRNEYLNVAKWMIYLSRFFPILIVNENEHQMNYIFHMLCIYGHLDAIEWLLQLNPDINISEDNDYAFINVCRNGHLKVAKWLLQVCPSINISAEHDFAFYMACYNGHLEVAKWLLQVCPRIIISVNCGYIFRYICSHGSLEVAQWLQSLNPNLYVIYHNAANGTYRGYIRTEEEERWERRKYMVWLASDNSPNKKSIMYRLPQDVSRFLIEYV